MKNNNGITIVALVVTIVVLLILAGVSINLVLGNNGIVKKAQEPKKKTKLQKYMKNFLMSSRVNSLRIIHI